MNKRQKITLISAEDPVFEIDVYQDQVQTGQLIIGEGSLYEVTDKIIYSVTLKDGEIIPIQVILKPVNDEDLGFSSKKIIGFHR